MNARQTILTLLAKAEHSKRKSEIANEAGYTIQTTEQALAELGRSKSIAQSKGHYTITPVGRKQIAEDKFLTAFTSSRPIKTRNDTLELPLDLIARSGMCQQVLKMKEVLPAYTRIQEEFLPYALMWLAHNNYPLPEYSDSEVEEAEEYEFREEVMNYVLDSLIFDSTTSEDA